MLKIDLTSYMAQHQPPFDAASLALGPLDVFLRQHPKVQA